MLETELIAALGLAASLALAPGPGMTGEISEFIPTGLLTRGAAQDLPFAPAAVTAFDDVVFVVGGADGEGEILRIDAATLQITGSKELGITPSAMVADFDQTLLFMIGKRDDGQTAIEVRDIDLNPVSEIAVKQPMQHPALTMTQNDILIVGSLPGAEGYGALTAFDMSRPSQPRPLPDLLPNVFGPSGVAKAWLDDTSEGTLFVSTALPVSLIAVATQGKAAGARLSGLDFDDAAPVQMTANMSNRPCLTPNAVDWFLISSVARLFLASYDPASTFKSLDVVSLTETNLNIEGKYEPRYFDDTKVQISTDLLASSCDMGVVWISNRNSREVEQFAVNAKADPPTLEKVGKFSLDEAPDRLVMTESGQHGYVVSAATNTLTRFDAGGGTVSGTGLVRTLQRLLTEQGYSVGAIDGQIGSRTLDAAARFERNNNVILDARRSPESAIEMLKAAPKF